MKVVRLSALRTGRLYQEIFLVLIYVKRLSRPQGHSATERMSMINSNDTSGIGTRDLPACSAVPQPTAPPRVPSVAVVIAIYFMHLSLHYSNEALFTVTVK
jgi:hypothetical protein